MRLLLDTCTFVWLVANPAEISKPAKLAIGASPLFLSDVSIWEICIKWQAGKLDLPQPPRSWIADQCRIWEISRVALEQEHLFRATELPLHHRDPFDRLLVAQSLVEGLVLVTPDVAIKAYPVSILW